MKRIFWGQYWSLSSISVIFLFILSHTFQTKGINLVIHVNESFIHRNVTSLQQNRLPLSSRNSKTLNQSRLPVSAVSTSFPPISPLEPQSNSSMVHSTFNVIMNSTNNIYLRHEDMFMGMSPSLLARQSKTNFTVMNERDGTPNMDRQEVLMMEYAVNSAHQAIYISIHSIPNIFRTVSGTIAGIVSLSIKSLGGIFNVMSEILHEASVRIALKGTHYQTFFSRIMVKIITSIVYGFAKAFQGLGMLCILTGDTVELVAVGMGQALVDSFVGLSNVISLLRTAALFFLRRDHEAFIYKPSFQKEHRGEDMRRDSTANDSAVESSLTSDDDNISPLFKETLNEFVSHWNIRVRGAVSAAWIQGAVTMRSLGRKAKSLKLLHRMNLTIGNVLHDAKTLLLNSVSPRNKGKSEGCAVNSDSGDLNNPLPHRHQCNQANVFHVGNSIDPSVSNISQFNVEPSHTRSSHQILSGAEEDECSVSGGRRPDPLIGISDKLKATQTQGASDSSEKDTLSQREFPSFFPHFVESIARSFRDIFCESYVPSRALSLSSIDNELLLSKTRSVPTLRLHTFMVLCCFFFVAFLCSLSCNTSSDRCRCEILASSSSSVDRLAMDPCQALNSSTKIKMLISTPKSDRRLSKSCRLFIGGISVCFAWIYLSFMEAVVRERLIVDSVVSSMYLPNTSQQSSLPFAPLRTAESSEDMESARWFNSLITSMWNLSFREEGVGSGGGIGPYIGSAIETVLSRQLSLVPPGVANIQLKRFNIGSKPPVILAVRAAKRERRQSCMKYALPVHGNHNPYNISENQDLLFSQSRIQNSSFFETLYDDFIQALLHFSETTAGHHSRPDRDADRHNIRGAEAPETCEQVIADIDFSFISKDMDMVFTLRPDDMRSMLPEGAITVSDVLMRGRLRMHIDLIPDFPFVGNATVSEPT